PLPFRNLFAVTEVDDILSRERRAHRPDAFAGHDVIPGKLNFVPDGQRGTTRWTGQVRVEPAVRQNRAQLLGVKLAKDDGFVRFGAVEAVGRSSGVVVRLFVAVQLGRLERGLRWFDFGSVLLPLQLVDLGLVRDVDRIVLGDAQRISSGLFGSL